TKKPGARELAPLAFWLMQTVPRPSQGDRLTMTNEYKHKRRYRQRADGERVKRRVSRKKQRRTTAFADETPVSLGSLIRLNPLARRLEPFTAFTCMSGSLSGRPQ